MLINTYDKANMFIHKYYSYMIKQICKVYIVIIYTYTTYVYYMLLSFMVKQLCKVIVFMHKYYKHICCYHLCI